MTDAARFDPVRHRLIEAMARRAQAHDGEARRRIDARIDALRTALQEDMARAVSHPVATAQAPQAAPQKSPLAALVAHIAQHAPAPVAGGTAPLLSELKSVSYFRGTWSRLSADRRMVQSLAKVPENAGPLNSHQLVHRSLGLMRDMSPEYLNRFMAYVDGLLWLEQANAAEPAAAAGRGESPRKAAAKKTASKSVRTKAG